MKISRFLLPFLLHVFVLGCGADNTGTPNDPIIVIVESEVVGPKGGTIKVGKGELVIPEGALSTPTKISFSTLSDPEQINGIDQFGERYVFGPEGLTFDSAVIIKLPRAQAPETAQIYWSKPNGETGFAPLETTWEGDLAVTSVTHFSQGFVGNSSEVSPECGDCDGGDCVDGQCICPLDRTLCTGICSDFNLPSNCGSCGNVCGSICSKNQACEEITILDNIKIGMCAVFDSGKIRCWGFNQYGQLGNGSNDLFSNKPVIVKGISNAKSIVSSEDSTCAILDNGEVHCWGIETNGQIDDGISTFSTTPIKIPGLSNVKQIYFGGDHTCALLNSNNVRCWGSNDYGQLGNDTLVDSKTPVSVRDLGGVKSLSLSYRLSCALLISGKVKCWGTNVEGALGDETFEQSSIPVDVVELSGVKSLESGLRNTCALTNSGKVKCWGRNDSGQLGNGTNEASNIPVSARITGTATSIISRQYYTCAVMSAGGIQCWGSTPLINSSNQTLPTTIQEISGATSLSLGEQHACAILNDGEVQCWGENNKGQLGRGMNPQGLKVQGISNAKSLSSIHSSTCALLTTGGIKCWGTNGVGQLGDGTTMLPSSPVDVLW